MEQKSLAPLNEELYKSKESNWRNWAEGETHTISLVSQQEIPGGKPFNKDPSKGNRPTVSYVFDYWDGAFGEFKHESSNKSFMRELDALVKSGVAAKQLISIKRVGKSSDTTYMAMAIPGEKPKKS